MSFIAAPEHYDRFMGRYLPTLAPAFADAAGVVAGMRVLDVGAGPGGLTAELVARTGAEAVAAIEPSPPFAQACRERNPGVDVREGVAEALPFPGDAFDAALASLVVGFMRDAPTGVAEMARVTRPGGTVAACMWDRQGMEMLSHFWRAAATIDPSVQGEERLLGGGPGELAELFETAGLAEVEEGVLHASARYSGFDDLWEPVGYGIGPAGAHLASLEPERRSALGEALRAGLETPEESFELTARAWFARGRVS